MFFCPLSDSHFGRCMRDGCVNGSEGNHKKHLDDIPASCVDRSVRSSV